jgi:hypothetical protein
VDGHGRVWLGRMGIVLLSVVSGRHLVRPSIVAPVVVVSVSVAPTGRLGRVGHDLHAARNGTSWPATACSICRRSRTPESLLKLFQEGAADVIRCNVHGVCDPHDD